MKYYVVGKSEGIKATKDNDSDSLVQYWEMGYELSSSRILLLRKVVAGEVDPKSDVIVTLEDRMYLYQSIFDNVIPYEEFKEMDQTNLDICWDLSNHYFMNSPIFVNQQLLGVNGLDYDIKTFSPEFLKLITDTKKTEVNPPKPFYLIHYRERSRCSERNLTREQYFEIFDCLKKFNYDYYVYGQNCDTLLNETERSGLSLSEANSYMAHPICRGVIGPLSGGTMISLLTHKGKHHVIDFNRQNVPSPIKGEGNDTNPILHGPASNFIGAEIINHFTVEDLLEYIHKENTQS